MDALQKMALADFVNEEAAGIAAGDIAGTAILYAEMALEAETSGVMLPLQQTIAHRAKGRQGEMSDHEFDPRTAE